MYLMTQDIQFMLSDAISPTHLIVAFGPWQEKMIATSLMWTMLSALWYWFNFCLKLLTKGKSVYESESKWHSALSPIDTIWPCHIDINVLGDTTELYYRPRPMRGTVEILCLEKHLWDSLFWLTGNLKVQASEPKPLFNLIIRPHTESLFL